MGVARRSGSNSFCFAIQFSWAPVHEIFNKKVDISSGAFCSPFVPSLFLRKRLHRKKTCRVSWSVSPTSIFVAHPDRPPPSFTLLRSINKILRPGLISIPSLSSPYLTLMPGHLLPCFIPAKPEKITRTWGLIDRAGWESCLNRCCR